jgi:hypothetical protein
MDARTFQGVAGVVLFTAGLWQALGVGWAIMFVGFICIVSTTPKREGR